MTRNRSFPTRGMSLVEVLVALVFLAFGLAGVMEMYITQSRHVARTQRLDRVTSLAYGFLAQMQETGYAALEQKTRVLAEKTPGSGQFDMYPNPIRVGSDVQMNATLKKETREGVPCIQIRVRAFWQPGTAGGAAVAAEQGIRKEVVGYVAAP